MSDVFLADRVTLAFGDREVLRSASVEVLPGEVHALVGPNGAGKSTLLKTLCGDYQPSGGCISLNGRRLDDIGLTEQARLRSVMSQSSQIVFDFTVGDVLAMGWVRDRVAAGEGFDRALDSVMTDCAIGELYERSFNTLSGGEQQRVQFARALLQIWPDERVESRYLLLDEPTANLDLAHELVVLRLARRAAANGVGVLTVLHDLNLAARFADVISILSGGRLVASGPPEAVLEDQRLSTVYGTPVVVERHDKLQRLVIHSQS